MFVAGALVALPTNDLDVHTMVALMVVAAMLGYAVNYTIGRLFGEKLFSNPDSKIFGAVIWIKRINFMPVTAVKRLFWRASYRL